MSKENVKEIVPETTEEVKNEEVKVKTRKKIHFQSPFRTETVEVPAKVKKEKKAKEPKKERDPNKKKFGAGFGLGFAAGVPVGAAAGFFGIGARKGTEDISEEDEDELEDLEGGNDNPGESSEVTE